MCRLSVVDLKTVQSVTSVSAFILKFVNGAKHDECLSHNLADVTSEAPAGVFSCFLHKA